MLKERIGHNPPFNRLGALWRVEIVWACHDTLYFPVHVAEDWPGCVIFKRVFEVRIHITFFLSYEAAHVFFFSFVIVETLRKVRAGDGRRTHIESIKTHSLARWLSPGPICFRFELVASCKWLVAPRGGASSAEWANNILPCPFPDLNRMKRWDLEYSRAMRSHFACLSLCHGRGTSSSP